MNFQNFKSGLDTVVVSKKVKDINPDKIELNTFMTYRWLSMDENLLKSVANIQQINSKLTAEQEYKLLLFNTPKLNRFNPRYIKK